MNITPQGRLSRLGDILMLPLMYLLQGTIREIPQQTHRWNNCKFSLRDLASLQTELLVTVAGDSNATQRWWGPLPIFHIPLLGGWSKFSVIAPTNDLGAWYIGWVVGDSAGISQIKLTGPVRVLLGPGPAQFFGISIDGRQITLEIIGHGRIGQAGKFTRVPLL